MTWKDKYDVVNRTDDGDFVLFGEHYSEKEVHKHLLEYGYEEKVIINFDVQKFVFVHFGLFKDDDGDTKHGWTVHELDEYKKGFIKAIHVYESLDHAKARKKKEANKDV